MTGAEVFNALLQRGYSPEHAAALGGHILQESGGNPEAFNKFEDAHGLLQFRGDRWSGLQNYAVSRNASPNDPNVQLDWISKEMAGPEAKAGAKFMAASDLPSASAALKSYIRWGDNSDATRLSNAQALLNGGQPGASVTPAANGGPAQPAAPSPQPGSGDAAPVPPDTGLQTALQGIQKNLATQQQADTPAPLTIQAPEPLVTPAMVRARQLAAAMMSKSLNPGTPT